MSNLAQVTKKGDKVQVWNPLNEVDPNIYLVTGIKQSIIELENIKTEKFHRVHKTRIAKIIVDNELEEVQKTMDTTAEKPKKAKKEKKEKVKKPKPEKVNFKQLVADGYEVYSMTVPFTKDGTTPVDGMKVESHCVIAPDKASYRVFNTYNGTLGKKPAEKKKNPMGVEYNLKDEKALEKKRRALEKKGYKKRKK